MRGKKNVKGATLPVAGERDTAVITRYLREKEDEDVLNDT
jgi:hypothetical protein